MNKGDVVYFKEASTEPAVGSKKRVRFTGQGYGVLLGMVKPFEKEVAPILLLRDMGAIGFMPFDDLKEFLGEEVMKAVVEKWTDKYWGKRVPETTAVEEAKAPLHIVSPEGHQIVSAVELAKAPPRVILIKPDEKPN